MDRFEQVKQILLEPAVLLAIPQPARYRLSALLSDGVVGEPRNGSAALARHKRPPALQRRKTWPRAAAANGHAKPLACATMTVDQKRRDKFVRDALHILSMDTDLDLTDRKDAVLLAKQAVYLADALLVVTERTAVATTQHRAATGFSGSPALDQMTEILASERERVSSDAALDDPEYRRLVLDALARLVHQAKEEGRSLGK